MESEEYTFVIAINDESVYEKNFLSSQIFYKYKNQFQIIIKKNYKSASIAYNEAINESKNNIIIFTHQDIFFPESWIEDLRKSLSYLRKIDNKWGVLGVFGSAKGKKGGVGRVYTTGLGIHGNEIKKPEPVETIDEIVIIVKKSSGLYFDPYLPSFHLYGADICLRARERGMRCYAIPAFCIHNTNQIINFPKDFYQCYQHIKKRWKKYLPIYTSCIKISFYNEELYKRKLLEFFRKLLGKNIIGEKRIEEPKIILEKIQSKI